MCYIAGGIVNIGTFCKLQPAEEFLNLCFHKVLIADVGKLLGCRYYNFVTNGAFQRHNGKTFICH